MPAAKLYPWDVWFARLRPVRLERGIHYVCSSVNMAQMVRNEASRRRTHVSVEETESGLKVTIDHAQN